MHSLFARAEFGSLKADDVFGSAGSGFPKADDVFGSAGSGVRKEDFGVGISYVGMGISVHSSSKYSEARLMINKDFKNIYLCFEPEKSFLSTNRA